MKQKTFDRQSAKFIARVIENLPDLSGNEIQFLIDNPSLLQLKIYDALVPKSRQKKYKKVWRTINITKNLNLGLSEVQKVLHEQDMEICPVHAQGMVSKLHLVSPSNAVINLACTTPEELGFKKPPTLSQLYERASDVGLGLCSHELAIYLRLDYKEQPKGELLRIAMTPIDNRVFYIGHFEYGAYNKEGYWMVLGAKDGVHTDDLDNRHDLDTEFIFTIV